MVWFLVDDNLARHRKPIQAGNPAMGLWVMAGAWAAGNMTNGYVPANVARQLGSENQIKSLLNVGLWSRGTDGVTTGYQFHDWSDIQPSSDQIRQRREAARKRKQKQRNRATDVTRDPRAGARPNSVRELGSLPHQADGAAARPPAADCSLCDDDGYRPNRLVCDHIDRTETHAEGSAAAREAFNENKIRRHTGRINHA